jgi:hypothetical protein
MASASGAVAITQDVTQTRSLERELASAQKLESIGQLAAGIAHEINTPTQFVGDNIRFLQQSVVDVLGIVERECGDGHNSRHVGRYENPIACRLVHSLALRDAHAAYAVCRFYLI